MKLLLFDIDGTLIRGRGAGRRSLGRAFAQVFGVADIEAAMDRVEFNGRTDPQIIRRRPRRRDRRSRPRPALARARHLPEHLRGLAGEPGGPTLPRLSELDRLVDRPGIALGLLTGNIEPGARIKLEPFGMNRYFADGGYGSDHEERPTIAAIARQKFRPGSGTPSPRRMWWSSAHGARCHLRPAERLPHRGRRHRRRGRGHPARPPPTPISTIFRMWRRCSSCSKPSIPV
jgi:phosphoglycolate phosphatase-like HAD superfamily hydrolase